MVCTSCGAQNSEGAKFCVKCGASFAPPAGSWRSPSGSLNNQQTDEANRVSGGYTPQPPPAYPVYNPPQSPMGYQQSTGAEPMHPAIPAIVSLLLPGIGLLFVPNKAGLGLGIFAGVIVYGILSFILSFVFIGLCMFLIMPLFNVAAAIHSYDESAKVSNGKFQPLLFK